MSTTTTYTITGMTCDHCVAHIKTEVAAIPGVTGVELSLASAQLVVTAATTIDFALIAAAVDEAGDYGVVLS